MVKAGVEAGIDKSVLVQASSAYAFDNSYVADSVAAHPERFTGVFSMDVVAPDAVEKMKHWMGRGLTGMRIFTSGSTHAEQETFFADEAAFPVWQSPATRACRSACRCGWSACRSWKKVINGSRRRASSSTTSRARKPPTARRSRPPRRSGRFEISERLSQAHPPADRTIGKGQVDARAFPRQGDQGVRRATHHLGLELPGCEAAAARTDPMAQTRFPSSRLRIKIGFSTRPP